MARRNLAFKARGLVEIHAFGAALLGRIKRHSAAAWVNFNASGDQLPCYPLTRCVFVAKSMSDIGGDVAI